MPLYLVFFGNHKTICKDINIKIKIFILTIYLMVLFTSFGTVLVIPSQARFSLPIDPFMILVTIIWIDIILKNSNYKTKIYKNTE